MTVEVLRRLRCVLAIVAAGFLPTAGAAVDDLNLLVDHEISEVGDDGVTRIVRFQERVYRRDRIVWIERVLPAVAVRDRHAHEGAASHEHRHGDLAGATLWITLDTGKQMNVRAIDLHGKAIVNVPPAEYGSVGFDGNRDNAWHLLDPKQLKAMTPLPDAAPRGMRWHGSASDDRTVRVLWDEKAAIPRRVLTTSRSGAQHKQMTVKDIAAPARLPWTALDGYREREYSDYLD